MKREIQYVIKHFDKLVNKYNTISQSDDDGYHEQKLGDYFLLWRTPGVLWINAYEKIEPYEGEAIQIGLSREGELVWEYQGHCSCYGWHNSALERDMIIPDFKTKIEQLGKNNWYSEPIINGETPLPLNTVEEKFWQTLKEIIRDFKESN